MKQFFSLFLSVFLCLVSYLSANAQTTVIMPGSGTEIITEFSGTLLDPGGTGDYGNSITSTVVIAPSGACSVAITFLSFNTENGFDYVRIYDGEDATGELLGEFDDITLPNDGDPITSTLPAMTIVFTSDGSVVRPGFEATWDSQSGSTDATFIASDENPPANYPVVFMPATMGSASYLWDFGDGTTSSEEMPSHSFAVGTYTVELTVTNCSGETGSFNLSITTQQDPEITLTPNSFELSLNPGESQTEQVNIRNDGNGDLIYTIEGATIYTPGGVSVLSLINDVNASRYTKTLNAINFFFEDYTLEEIETTSPAALEAALAGKSCLLIAEQTVSDAATFSAFAPVLQTFVEEGGRVIFTGAANGEYIFSTGLFSGTGSNNTVTGVADVLLPDDPLLTGFTGVYSAQVTSYLYDITNTDVVRVLESGDLDLICYRNIGDGAAIFIGHNYNFSNDDNKLVIANAVEQSVSFDWVSVTSEGGVLTSGESTTFDVIFDTEGFCGGTYTLDLLVNTNDPDEPQIIIPCTLTITGTPSLGFLQSNFDFGTIQQFDTETQTLSLTNNGTAEVVITDIISADPAFLLNDTAFVVPGCGGRIDIEFTFAPLDIATHTTSLTIVSSAGTFGNIFATGTSVGAPITTVTPDPIQVTINVGEATTQQLVLSNSGLGPLTFDIDEPDAFWLDISNGSGTVESFNEQNVSLVFDATTLLGGIYETVVVIHTNDPVQPTITIPVTMTVVGIPQLVTNTFSLDFGNVVIGNTPELTLTISNPGTDDLIISGIASTDPAFTSDVLVDTLDPGETITVTITFTPTAIQSYIAALTIENNAGPIGISLNGVGQGAPIAASAPASFNVSLEEPETNTQSLNLTNAANAQGILSYAVASGNVLVINHGSLAANYANLLDALEQYASAANISTLDVTVPDPAELTEALLGKQLLIIPPADFVASNALTVLAPVMQAFANAGGTVLMFGSTCCLPNTGLLAGFWNFNLAGSPVNVLDDSTIMTDDLTTGYVPAPETNIWIINNPDYISLVEGPFAGSGSVLGYRPQGSGKVVFLGYNFQEIDVQMGQTLGNILDFGAQLPAWLSVSPLSGSINIGDDENIAFTFSTADLPTGTYIYNLSLSTNDPFNPVIVVPCTLNVIALPDANFSVNTNITCTGEVSFTDLSLNVPNEWLWNFGDGTTSNAQNPTHTYTVPGEYTVSLNACNDVGCNEVLEFDFIDFNPNGYFCDTLILAASSEILSTECGSMLYDSGGPSGDYVNNENSVIHVDAAGAQSISLYILELVLETCCDRVFVYDGPDTSSPILVTLDGTLLPTDPIVSTSDQMTIQFTTDGSVVRSGFKMYWECTVIDAPPVPNYVFNIESECEGVVNFNDNSTIFPSEWQWDFGDGTTSTEENPTHEYAQSGTYQVSLVACNIAGCSEAITQTVSLPNVLTINFNISPNDTVPVGTPVFFQDVTPGVVSRVWTYGDGIVFFNNATAIHAYNTAGVYDMSLQVTNADGCQKTKGRTIWVGDFPIGTDSPAAGIVAYEISPNPSANGLFQVSYNLVRSAPVSFRVYDLLGKEVLHKEQDAQGVEGQTLLDLSSHTKGLYWLNFSADGQMITKKIVVQ